MLVRTIRTWVAGGLIGLILIGLVGCASTPYQYRQLSTDLTQEHPRQVRLSDVPFFPQRVDHCGPATLAMLMNHRGESVQPDDLVDRVFLEGRGGSLQAEMLAATRRQGLLPYVHPRTFSNLLAQLADGHPVLVLKNLGFEAYPVWHYAVVIGYDLDRSEIVLHTGRTRADVQSFERFERDWRGSDYWAMTMHRPGEVPADVEVNRYLDAAAGLEQAERFQAAESAFQTATRLWPDNAMAWLGLGNARYRLEHFSDAESAYRRAVTEAPDNAAAQHNLAWSLIRQGNLSAAKQPALTAKALADDQGDVYRGAWREWQRLTQPTEQ